MSKFILEKVVVTGEEIIQPIVQFVLVLLRSRVVMFLSWKIDPPKNFDSNGEAIAV